METQAAPPTQYESAMTVVVADHSDHFRETLLRVMNQMSDAAVVGEAANLRDALHVVRRTGAGVVLLDVDLAMNQPAARLRRLAGAFPDLKVIVLLNEDLPGYRQAISERWGYACVAKERAETELPIALADAPAQRKASPA
jgi:DNA-binding NarL/FixJ family response regulator